ncbi:uncharacterized protein [Panulirus ornatus]|uniref:uncharacterized protein n=1 Tax=Panulirus ornatus TaxID=150431 RepID=UPI003A8444D6
MADTPQAAMLLGLAVTMSLALCSAGLTISNKDPFGLRFSRSNFNSADQSSVPHLDDYRHYDYHHDDGDGGGGNDYDEEENISATIDYIRQLLRTTKNPGAMYELLGLLESAGFRRGNMMGSDDNKCVSMTFTSTNCTLILQLPDLTPALASLQEAWEEGGLQVLGSILRIVRVINRPCTCALAQVESGCPAFLTDIQFVMAEACAMP